MEYLLRRLFLLDDIFFGFFLFFAFLLIGTAFLLLRFLFLDLSFFAIAIGIDDNFFKLLFILHEKFFAFGILTLMDDIPSMHKLIVGEVGISIFTFLLEIWQIGVVVDCLVEIVDLLVGEHSGWIFEELVVIVEAELSFSVV